MNRIHKKTALSPTNDLILAAHDAGEGLLWERYEAQLPLCAFTANGLSCRRCLQGPCRINPFGDRPDRGVCGADRDQIVMENLFALTLEGVLETARSLALFAGGRPAAEFPDLAADLPQPARERLSAQGILPARKDQIWGARNSYFSHKDFLPQTLKDLTRLGLIHYGFMKELGGLAASPAAPEGALDPEGIQILVAGQASAEFLSALRRLAEPGIQGKKVSLWSQGAKALTLAPAADHGSPELALAMNLDALVLAPDASFPALEALARKSGVPVILADETQPPEKSARSALDRAWERRRLQSHLTPLRLEPGGEQGAGSILSRGREVRTALGEGKIRGILLIWGEPAVKQAFFERALTLVEQGLSQGLLVLLGGDFAAHSGLLREETARRMGPGEAPPKEEGFDRLCPVGPLSEVPRLVSFLRDLDPRRGFDGLPVAVAFPEFFRASTWATAVSFLSLGFSVQVGTPLPIWGSPSLTEVLLRDWPRISGGSLLASPSLPDSQTQAREILSLVRGRKMER